MELDFEKDMRINEDALDVELLNQAEQLFKYGKMMAVAKREVDEKRVEMDLLSAQIDKLIRDKPLSFGIDKITEAAVTSTIKRQESYIKFEAEYQEAVYNYNVISTAYNAIREKGNNLSNLVKLHGSNYFAGPSEVVDLSTRRKSFSGRLETATDLRVSKKLNEKRGRKKEEK